MIVTVSLIFNFSWIKTPSLSPSYLPISRISLSKLSFGYFRGTGWAQGLGNGEVWRFSGSLLSLAFSVSSSPSTLLPTPPNQKGESFQVSFPLQNPPKALIALGSSTHCHTWKENFLSTREHTIKWALSTWLL